MTFKGQLNFPGCLVTVEASHKVRYDAKVRMKINARVLKSRNVTILQLSIKIMHNPCN